MRLRRLSAVVRGPRLLAAALVLVLAYLFATNLTPRPRFVVRTEAKADQSLLQIRGPSFWGSVTHVSEDGRQIIVGIHRGDFRGYDSRLEMWDAQTGMNLTPAHWNAADWCELLRDGANARPTGLME